MKAETGAFLEKARAVLARADTMLQVRLNEDAARAAYLACFHVAQAYIFERTGKVAKSHKGVQAEFFRLTKEDGGAESELRKFLSRAYEFKSVADYSTGPDAVVSAAEASGAVATAREFVAHFGGLIVATTPAAHPDPDISP